MCKWTEINIEPRDVLFFRGAKPMGGSALGEGARWPMPSVFHHALLSAFHARWPEAKTKHQHIRGDENKNSSFLYGDLKTVGVFPERLGRAGKKTLYFPMPSDVQFLNNDSAELCVLEPREMTGKGDLPAPLEKALFKPPDAEATKRTPHRWISDADLLDYLAGKPLMHRELEPLFDVESRPGIGIDPQTGTADAGTDTEGGKFYLAEYMRLRDGVSLKGFAVAETLDAYFADSAKSDFVLGGQRGVAHLAGVRDDTHLPTGVDISGTCIKWVTLTPAIFTGGWLPSWIDQKTGAIKGVETEKVERRSGESRKDWRARFKTTPIPGKLVAASIPKPVPYSGWKAHATGKEGAKPTRLCVPAGAVYYFEVPEGENPEPARPLPQWTVQERYCRGERLWLRAVRCVEVRAIRRLPPF